MFEYQPSRHPLQTFQFWFAVFICSAGVTFWRFGGFQSDQKLTILETVTTEELHEELPPPPFEEFELGDTIELTAAPLQHEELAPVAPLNAEGVSSSGNNSTPVSNSLEPVPSFNQAQQAPTHNEVRLSANETGIRQLSGEQSTTKPLKTASLDLPQLDQHVAQPVATSSTLDLTKIDMLISAGDDVIALRKLSTIYWQSPEQRSLIRGRLEELARRIYFRPQPHYMDPYEVQFGERLELIAKKYQVPWQYLEKLNRIDAQKLRAGKKLKVIQGPFSIVVDLSKFEATVHAHGYFVVRMPVGIGKDGATPVGTFRVTDKVVDPVYYGPDGVIKNDDPLNPLGEHWIAISDEANSLQGYGLHGTIEPNSIGKSESKGCVRFHDQDIADLYDLLTIGSEVVIRR